MFVSLCICMVSCGVNDADERVTTKKTRDACGHPHKVNVRVCPTIPPQSSIRGTKGAMANVSSRTTFTQFAQSRRVVDDGSRDGLFLILDLSSDPEILSSPRTNRCVLFFVVLLCCCVVVGGVAISLHRHHGLCLCDHRTDIQNPESSERVTALRIRSALFPFKKLKF